MSDPLSVSLALRPRDVYAIDEAGNEVAAPERRESEFARALEADFKRRHAADSAAAAAAADEPNHNEAPVRSADEVEKQWFEVYQNLKHARGEVEQAGALLEALLARRHLTAQHVPTPPPPVELVAQQRRIAVQAKREQLHSAASNIFVHCESLRRQLAADRVFYGQLQRLCARWRLVLGDNGALVFDYVPLLTAARDAASVAERAVCVRVQDGNVALRVPPMRALALGRRIVVSCGARRLALLHGPIAVVRRPTDAPHGVVHCDDLLVRARHSVWLERIYQLLLRESSVLATDVAYQADDRRESDLRAVNVVLSLADEARALSLSFQLESGADAAAAASTDDADDGGGDAAATRKRRFGGDAEEAPLDAIDDEALTATCAVLDTVLSRICVGIQLAHRERLALLTLDSLPAPILESDARVAKWAASDEDGAGDSKAKPTPSMGGPLPTLSTQRRAKLHAFFVDGAPAAPLSSAVSLVEAVRLLFAHCRSEAVARAALARLTAAFGGALQCAWQAGASPFESECRLLFQGEPVDTLLFADGKVTLAHSPLPADVLQSPPHLIQFALRQQLPRLEKWFSERTAAEKHGATSLDALLRVF